jgi:hypothetical protein
MVLHKHIRTAGTFKGDRMSRAETVIPLIPFNKLLQKLLINSGATHADNKVIDDAISRACSELGIMTADLQIVEVARPGGKKYDLGFMDPNPENRGAYISLTGARGRAWTPFSKTPEVMANPFDDAS